MIMKKLYVTWLLSLVSILGFARNYPFSIDKSGFGEQAIVFIPGFACSGDVWEETVAHMRNSHTCYVLTMAGFAGVAPEEEPTFEGWKTQIARFIQEENIGRPILIGHSMGGGLSLAIASDYPDLIQKTVIVDALPCLMALNNPGFKSIPDNDCSEMIGQLTAMPEEQFAQMQRMSVASLTSNPVKFEEIAGWGLKSDRKTWAKLYCDFSNTDLRERIESITVPSLVLLEPPFKNIEAVIEDQYKNLSTAELRYAEKGLHFIMFDDKEWFIDQVTEFIKE